MKRICLLALLWAITIVAGCKKENIVKNVPTNGKPPESETPKDPEPAVWHAYTTANSQLSNDQVNAIAIGKNDIKWIGTANGLVRINGDTWTTYNKTNSALPSSDIRSLAVEENGTVWVGTDQGLAQYDGSNWLTYNNKNSVLTNNNIKCIAHDAKHHTTWIGTDEGFVKIDAANHWEYIDGPDIILSMAVDQNGALWLGTFNSFAFIGIIKKYNNGEWTSYRLDLLGYASALPYAIAVDKNNAVIAVLAGTVVKSVIKLSDGYWQEVARPEQATGFKTLILENDKIWVGGKNLSVFGDKNSPVLTIPENDSPIQAMAIDSQGRKWLGTIYGGLAVYGKPVNR